MGNFSPFENINYRFGGEDNSLTIFQNISAYADIIDQFKDSFQHYLSYQILEGDRPDVLAAKMYGDSKYYWTFFLMNDHLRRQGWPLTYSQLVSKITATYPNVTLVFRTDDYGIPHVGHPDGNQNLFNIFKVGSFVTGTQSGAKGTVIRKNMDFGQIILNNNSGTWINGETVKFDRITENPLSLLDPNSIEEYEDITFFENARLKSASTEILSTHHYEDADGNWVDIDPRIEEQPAFLTEITRFDYNLYENEKLRKIKVIKPGAIRSIHRGFVEFMAG